MKDAQDKLNSSRIRPNRRVALVRSKSGYFTPIERDGFACFECRVSFKLARQLQHLCPNCAQPLCYMGNAFKAPAKNNLNQWRKVRKLREAGFIFTYRDGHPYRDDPAVEPFPQRLSEVDGFIRRNPNHPFLLAKPKTQ